MFWEAMIKATIIFERAHKPKGKGFCLKNASFLQLFLS
jgi:hypothetical protein